MKFTHLSTAILLGFATFGFAEAKRPNILMIVSDDLGYGDLSTYGSPDIRTPNIQDLADQGVRFTDAYAAAPICAPSRAALMTGKYPQRFGFENNIPDDPDQVKLFGLPTDQTTIADRLKARGYTTGLVGKWHLGDENKFRPNRRGFDYFYGFLDGGSDYFPGEPEVATIYENRQVVPLDQYMTFSLAEKAQSFIENHTSGPFFLTVSFNAPHAPREAPEEYLALFPKLKRDRKKVAAMVTAMDKAIGQIKGTLAREGLINNTLIVFVSDNGGVLKRGASSNSPFSGGKSLLNEGGVRIPLIMSMRGVLPDHKVYSGQSSLMDLVPTFMDLTGHGIGAGQTDGVNLFPFLTTDTTAVPHNDLFWRYQGRGAVRSDNYKLLIKDIANPLTTARLYDLSTDLAESKDIAAKNPVVVTALLAKFAAWNALNIPPLW